MDTPNTKMQWPLLVGALPMLRGFVRGLIENDERDGGALVDHVDERFLDVGPELAAAMRGPDAELEGKRPV